MTPRVTVVVPTRDRREALARALAGVDTQAYRDFELIVVDDASADRTEEWVREHRPDALLLAHPSPRGAAAARNLGVERARGELVALLDDDDAWDPDYLAAQVSALYAHPEATLSYADHVEVNPAGRRSRPDTRTLLPGTGSLIRLLADCPIHTSSVVVVRRDAFTRHGAFDESLAIVHDWEWYARVVAQGGVLHHLDRPLVERGVPGGLIRSHRDWYREESSVLAHALAGRPEDERLVRTYRALFFGRVALGRRDVSFGVARLVEAFRRSPRRAVSLAAAALQRRARPLPADPGAGS